MKFDFNGKYLHCKKKLQYRRTDSFKFQAWETLLMANFRPAVTLAIASKKNSWEASTNR